MLLQSRRGSSAAAFCYLVFPLRESAMQPNAMQPSEFAAYHLPMLERDEVRHNLIVAVLGRMAGDNPPELLWWSLGEPGQCAIKAPGYPILLGDVNAAQCHALAEATRSLDYPAVVGADETPRWFVERATELGISFLEPIPQELQMLRDKPTYPGIPGHARVVGAADTPLFSEWMCAFIREAIPHDPIPSPEQLAQSAASGRFQFWVVDGEPVSMAGIMRRTRHVAAIAGVYTPPTLRGHGYAGSVTAAVVDAIFAEGRDSACLYVDLRNPYSSRCYAKIGFTPWCNSSYYPRAAGAASAPSANGLDQTV
jgi:ribosomal protein S18 acetylase RimI-like enzyme